MAEKKPSDALVKLARAEDAKKAMAEYHANAAAVDANTERLRALRLAREAAEAAAKPAAAPKRKGAKGTKSAPKAKAAPGKLSDWLTEQKSSGRSS
jgi:hypothetical protein